MRTLPLLALALLLASGCDTLGPARGGLVGTWALASVTTSGGGEVAGPLGSTLTFRRSGAFGIASINSCSGEYVVHEREVWLDAEACTLIGAPVEADLAQFLYLGGSTPQYEVTASGDLRLDIVADGVFYRLTFERAAR